MVFEQYQYNARGDSLKTTFMVSGLFLGLSQKLPLWCQGQKSLIF